MASEKPELKIPVPHTGVRKDVNEMLQDGSMASKGENCLFYDGTIRPRPAVSNQGFGTDFAPAWSQVYADGDITDWQIWATVQADNGYLIASCVKTDNSDQKFMISTDKGASWEDADFTHPLTGSATTIVRWMEIIEDHLFCYGGNLTIADPTTHTPNEYLYRSSMASFPTAMTFTSIGPMEFDAFGAFGDYYRTAILPEKTNVTFDSDTGHLMFMYREDWNLEEVVWYLKDALTTTSVNDRLLLSDILPVQVAGLYRRDPVWLNNKWMVYGSTSNQLGWPTGTVSSSLLFYALEWNASTLVYDLATTYSSIEVYINDYDESTEDVNLGSNKDNELSFERPALDLGDGYCIQPLLSSRIVPGSDSVPELYDFLKFKINDPGSANLFSVEPHIVSTVNLIGVLGTPQFNFEYKNARVTGVMGDTVNYPTELAGLTSDDDGKSWKTSAFGAEDPSDTTDNKLKLIINEETFEHYLALFVDADAGDFAFDSIWYSPTSGGSGVYGDVTTVFQMDMDDEDEVVVAGTTKALLRLDVDNNIWERITADHDETVPGDPATTWVNSGDIPPLSVTDERDEYVTGTTIDATYGLTPWVFRTFEVQGKSVLVGTNGQCRPVIYHPDMAGGFARRLGEVPVGDINDLPAWDADSFPDGYLRTGNLAPVCKTIASAAGRLLAGNLVGVSPYGIDVSGFTDPDRGWGLEQTVLLGDTAGPLVTMREISALSVALYKSDSIYHAVAQTEFMGVAAPFRFELAKLGVAGPCSPASVLVNYDGRHIYLARDGGVYMYDGVAPIDGGRNIRRMVQNELNINELGKVWGMVDIQRKLVWFFYPSKDGLVNKGLVISTDQGYPWPAWPISLPAGWNFTTGQDVTFQSDAKVSSLRRLGSYGEETLGSFATGDRHLLMGTQNNLWYSQKWDDDGDYSDDGEPISIDLESGWVTPGEVRIYHVDELYHIFSSVDPLQQLAIRVKAQQIGQNTLQSKISNLWAAKKRRRTKHRIRGSQFKMQMRGNINRMFNWGGAVAKVVEGGQR